jgi:hypothetical protein
LRRIEIDAHAEIEIVLRLAADHRRQVKDRRRLRIDDRTDGGRIGDVALHHAHARIGEAEHRHCVEQHQLVDSSPPRLRRSSERPFCKSRLARRRPRKAGAPRNQNLHDISSRLAKNPSRDGVGPKRGVRSHASEFTRSAE